MFSKKLDALIMNCSDSGNRYCQQELDSAVKLSSHFVKFDIEAIPVTRILTTASWTFQLVVAQKRFSSTKLQSQSSLRISLKFLIRHRSKSSFQFSRKLKFKVMGSTFDSVRKAVLKGRRTNITPILVHHHLMKRIKDFGDSTAVVHRGERFH